MTRAEELRKAIVAMVTRYGCSAMDYGIALCQSPGRAEKHARAKSRRFAAIQRLTESLADLGDGA